jgi:NADH-quinone oxidoreductase subunit H
MQDISIQQGSQSSMVSYLLGIPFLETTSWGGFFNWNAFKMPVLFFSWIVFFISSLAESNRAPFDLPVAESEIVAGFYTEYSGFRWAVIMLAEYGIMLLVSILGAVLFFGSWNTPFPNVGVIRLGDWTSGESGSVASSLWGIFWLMSKSLFFVFLQMWIRWTYPRLRVDQLMALSWKYLTPFALLLVILCGLWKIFIL